MSASPFQSSDRSESPDPTSHIPNIYDTEVDENDDDMDFEPTTEGSEDIEYFEATEEDDFEYHGKFYTRSYLTYLFEDHY